MKAASVVELAVFTRQMSTIINSGIPLTQGLDIIADQIKNRRFKEIINGVSNDVKSGLSLEDALRKHPDAFSELYVNMAVAGENRETFRHPLPAGQVHGEEAQKADQVGHDLPLGGHLQPSPSPVSFLQGCPYLCEPLRTWGRSPVAHPVGRRRSDLIVNNIIFIVPCRGIFFL